MKKMLSLIIAATLGMSMLTGCSAKPAETTAAQTTLADVGDPDLLGGTGVAGVVDD